MFPLVVIRLNTPVLCLQECIKENLNGNAPVVNSLHPGELFDIELSKKDSGLGISVTVLFGKVFTLSLFCPLFPLILSLLLCRLYMSFGVTFLTVRVGRACGKITLFACFFSFLIEKIIKSHSIFRAFYSNDQKLSKNAWFVGFLWLPKVHFGC